MLRIISKNCNSLLLLTGIFHGFTKPSDPNEFLQDFVNEVIVLTRNGIQLENRVFSVEISNFICDAPARSFVTCTKGHSGYFACPMCIIEGDHSHSRVIYIDKQNPARTDESFHRKVNEEHHTGRSVLENTPTLNMVRCFPVDAMHLVYLGVVRRIMIYWISGPIKDLRQSKCEYDRLCSNLCAISEDLPSDFARRPRSVQFIKRWKASSSTVPFVHRSSCFEKLRTQESALSFSSASLHYKATF